MKKGGPGNHFHLQGALGCWQLRGFLGFLLPLHMPAVMGLGEFQRDITREIHPPSSGLYF